MLVQLGTTQVVTCARGAASELTRGQRVQVAVRPEQVSVETKDHSGPNRLPGTIQALLFIGDHYEATLALEVGQTVTAYLSADREWHEGERVCMSARPEDLRVWST